MSALPMSLAERIRKISGFALMASASQELAQKATSDALEYAHRQAVDGSVDHLLALMASEDGQAALRRLEELAVIAADFEARVAAPVAVIGIDMAKGPEVAPLKPCGSNWFPGSAGPWADADQVAENGGEA